MAAERDRKGTVMGACCTETEFGRAWIHVSHQREGMATAKLTTCL